MKRVLVIDDDKSICETLRLHLGQQGIEVALASTAREGLELLAAGPSCEALILDIRLPDKDGLSTLADIRRLDSSIPVIIITAFHDMPTTVRAMQAGAFEYIRKPIDIDDLDGALRRALKARRLSKGRDHYFTEVSEKYRIGDIVGKSKKMVEIFKTIGIVSQSKTTVLIEGDSGTGKELIARAIHEFTDKSKPFVSVNCGAIPETLLETELFGHEKGAFTGALYQKPGKFELADGGTLFLDEIGDMSLNMQVKLLRVMQEREFERVGGKEKIKTDVRIITATNRNLEELVQRGEFREDLYYRLKVITISVPPLRERREDIPLLVDHLVGKINLEMNKNIRRVSKAAMRKLIEHEWKGNIRELENVLRRAILLARGDILSDEHLELAAPLPEPETKERDQKVRSLDDLEREEILKALHAAKGNKSETCRMLGISYPTLQRKLKKYKVSI